MSKEILNEILEEAGIYFREEKQTSEFSFGFSFSFTSLLKLQIFEIKTLLRTLHSLKKVKGVH
jgi:hypothetical protein